MVLNTREAGSIQTSSCLLDCHKSITSMYTNNMTRDWDSGLAIVADYEWSNSAYCVHYCYNFSGFQQSSRGHEVIVVSCLFEFLQFQQEEAMGMLNVLFGDITCQDWGRGGLVMSRSCKWRDSGDCCICAEVPVAVNCLILPQAQLWHNKLQMQFSRVQHSHDETLQPSPKPKFYMLVDDAPYTYL